MSNVNLRFGVVRHDNANGTSDINFQFGRSDANTGAQQASGNHTLFALPNAAADKIMAGVMAHQQERIKSGHGHPQPSVNNGILSWSGIEVSDAEQIERHLMEGLVNLAPTLHGHLHGK